MLSRKGCSMLLLSFASKENSRIVMTAHNNTCAVSKLFSSSSRNINCAFSIKSFLLCQQQNNICRNYSKGILSESSTTAKDIGSTTATNPFINNGSLNSDSASCMFLTRLEELKSKGELKMAISEFIKFHKEHDWVKYWPSQRIAATILHIYYRAGLHAALLDLYEDMCRMGLQHGDGIYYTVIKSLLVMENWQKAFEYFQELKNHGLRNIRIYPHLIKAFARNKKLDLAYQIFKDMQTEELKQKTRKQLNDQEMLSSLIQAAIEVHFTDREKGHIEDSTPLKVVTSILNYLEERCILVTNKLSERILQWHKLQSNWSVSIVDQDSTYTYQENNKSTKKFQIEDLLYFMRSINSNLQDRAKSNILLQLEKFLMDEGPFDVFIDGANVMFASKQYQRKEDIHLQPENLLSVIQNVEKDSRVLVILPELVESRGNLSNTKQYKILTDLMAVKFMYTKDISDDIVLLYSALHSEMCKATSEQWGCVNVITNDSLRDHVPLLKQDQWKFLKWIRSRQVNFYFEEEIKIKLKSFPVYNSNYGWLFPREDGKLICIHKRE